MTRLGSAFRRVVGTALGFVAGALVLVLMAHVVANALLRAFANRPIEGTLEYVGNWYLPSIILLGLVLAQQRKEHVEAPVLFDRMPAPLRREIQILVNLVLIAFVFFMGYYAYVEAYHSMTIGETAGVSGVPIWFMKFAAPIGFFLYGIQLIFDTIEYIRGKVDPATELSAVQAQLAEMEELIEEDMADHPDVFDDGRGTNQEVVR